MNTVHDSEASSLNDGTTNLGASVAASSAEYGRLPCQPLSTILGVLASKSAFKAGAGGSQNFL